MLHQFRNVNNGDIVAFGDDIATFADQIGINESDIQIVEDD